MPPKHAGKNDASPALKEQISILARHLGSKGASKGGIARAEKLTPKQRSSIASKAADARWNSKGNIKKNEIPRRTYG
jgi:hypothetical protein